MRIVVLILLIGAAHLSLTANMPAAAGTAWIGWPFATDSRPVFRFLGGYPNALTQLLSAVAGIGFLLAALGLFWTGIPVNWWTPVVTVAAVCSIALFTMYPGPWAILPLVLDAAILWGVFFQNWTVEYLRGF